MNKAIKILQKHAGLFSKKPKWLTDEDWKNDEAAVNDWYDTWDGFGGSPKYRRQALEIGMDLARSGQFGPLAEYYNLAHRYERVDDKTAAQIDKLRDLGIITPEYHDYLLKQDRPLAADKVWFEAMNAVEENPDYDKIYEDYNWDDLDSDPDEKHKMTQYGKDLLDLYGEVYNYDLPKNAPTTRSDVGSIEDATPYQIAKWTEDAKQSPLLAGLKGALKYGLPAAGAGAGGGALAGLATGSGTTGRDALAAAAISGGVGSIYGALKDYAKTRRKKRYAKYRLNEKPIGKEASYKRAGLDNYWMAQNPETNKWDVAPLDEVSDGYMGDHYFRGKVYSDLVEAATDGSLYGMSPAPRGVLKDENGNDYYNEDPASYNWVTNEQCRRIYDQLRKLNPKTLKKLRRQFEGLYYIPDDDTVESFINQFGKHVDAGHSLYGSY